MESRKWLTAVLRAVSTKSSIGSERSTMTGRDLFAFSSGTKAGTILNVFQIKHIIPDF